MQRWGKSASSTALPASKRLRRSLVTLVLCVGLFLLYWYHWTPRVIARFLGLNSRSRGSEDGGVVRVSIGGPAGGGGGGGAARGVVSSSGGMGGSEASLVWVLLGDTHYQPYLLESIRQARVFNPTELFFLVVEPRFWPSNHTWIKQLNKYRVIRVNYTVLEDPFTHDFSKNYQRLWDELGRLLGAMMQPTINGKSNLDFTSHTMVRVVAVHQLMAQLDLQRVVHIENDQMIYGSIQEVRGAADTCGVKLALTKLGARLSFATIYIRDAPSLKAMLDFILDAISHGTEHAIKVAESRWVTDMSLPAAYLATRATALDDTVTTFPPEQDGTCLAEQSKFIFDALPLGTWCCGDFNHPRAHLTHKMEESYVKYWEKPFEWRGVAEQGVAKGKPLRKPFWNGTRVFNLHMHSKQLHLFRSTDITMNMTAFAEAAVPNGSFVDVGAFVYDCWTSDDVVWGHHGANWSEWNLVKLATPRFEGHLQPKVPLWGYLDTALPSSWDILTPAAVEHGVTVFLWDFYWFANMTSPVLANGLNKGFLNSSTRNQAKWAIMWANQDWDDIHPAKRDVPSTQQFTGALDLPTFKAMTTYWIENYLTLPNYYRVPDLSTTSPDRVCALINVYMIDTLVDGLGGLDQTAAVVADFRARAAAAGVPCIHLQAEGVSLHNVGRKSIPEVIAALGIDSVTDYCWQHYVEMKGFPLTDYPSYASQAISAYGERENAFKPAAYVPNFSIAWDPSPRTVQSDVFDAAALNSGYPFSSVLQPTVAEIATALETAASALTSKCSPAWCMLTTYAYTEFSEGGSLFPTVQDGYGRLQAFQAVFGNRSA